jgi:hypothetical protein
MARASASPQDRRQVRDEGRVGLGDGADHVRNPAGEVLASVLQEVRQWADQIGIGERPAFRRCRRHVQQRVDGGRGPGGRQVVEHVRGEPVGCVIGDVPEVHRRVYALVDVWVGY